MIDVTVILLNGGLPSTSMVPLEIFSCAGDLWETLVGQQARPRFRVRTVTIDGRPTKNAVPIALQPSGALADVRRTDLVIVPTAGMDLDEVRSANAGVIDWLKRRRGKAAVAGVCTGVCLLAEAGLLDGRPATTHWGVVDQCRSKYPQVQWSAEKFVTEADGVFCGGGLYGSIDLSLYLVEHYCGHTVAVQTAKALLLESPRIWQSAYAPETQPPAHDDELVQRAQKWILAHFRQPVDLDALASKVGMSSRNLSRRFKAATGDAPLAYVHALRIDKAKQQLESSTRSIQEISQAVGYEDVAFFRHLFRRHTGATPREYRQRFGPRRSA